MHIYIEKLEIWIKEAENTIKEIEKKMLQGQKFSFKMVGRYVRGIKGFR